MLYLDHSKKFFKNQYWIGHPEHVFKDEEKKFYKVVSREKVNIVNENTWKEEYFKAMNYKYGAITTKLLEFIDDKEIVYEITKKFKELYSNESTARQIELEKLRVKNSNDSKVLFGDFKKNYTN